MTEWRGRAHIAGIHSMISRLLTACSCGLALIVATYTFPTIEANDTAHSAHGLDDNDAAAVRTVFLREHCFACHSDGSEDKGGGVRLDTLSPDIAADIATADLWQKVLRVVNSGEMPPDDEKRPTAAALTTFLESLSLGLVDARDRLADGGTGITLRRLNRREYANTVRILTGVTPDVSNLPDDQGVGGYDTAGIGLTISSDQFEAYLATARSVLIDWSAYRAAWHKAGGKRKHRRDISSLDLVKTLKSCELEFDRAVTVLGDAGTSGPTFSLARNRHVEFLANTVASLRQPLSEQYGYLSFRAARNEEAISLPGDWPPGRYRLRVQCAAPVDTPRSRRFIDVGHPIDEFTILGCHEVLGTPDHPQVIEQEFTVRPGGSRIVAVHERRHNSHLHELAHYYSHLHAMGIGPTPMLGLDWLEIEGPLPEASCGDPALESLLSADTPVDDATFRKLLATFATQAFRGGAPSESFLDTLVSIRQMLLDYGAEPREAATESLAVIMASPAFLYLVEPSTENEVAVSSPLSDREVAVRLAYFLTSSPPDSELLAAAAAKTLTQPDRMIMHADRLLAGPGADQFAEGFVHQWLDLDRLAFFQFDPNLYWEFDDSTREASRQEVYRFFMRVLRENMPLRNFLDSDWTVANGLLGSYYGWKTVTGPEWRVVALPEQSHRGGLMGMAAILAMGSNGVHTSPVERGAWVLRKLLIEPPPPAPADVPQLSRLEGQLLSTRERLKAHQESPQCFHCHKKIDPIGFGMENFDTVGRWREEEVLTVAGKGTRSWRIDPSGTFLDGERFATYEELKRFITSREEAFARSVAANLLEYALGRPLSIADDPMLDTLMARTRASGYRLRDVVHAIITSEAFCTK